MSKTKRFEVLLVVVTVLALGAGLTAGLLGSRLPMRPAETTPVSPLVAELDLTPEQRDQMKLIWEDAQTRVVRAFNDAQSLQKGRDEEILRLLTEEQRATFSEISKKYADQYAELQKYRETLLQEAVEKTNKLLNPDQKAKYEKILSSRLGSAAPGSTTKTVD